MNDNLETILNQLPEGDKKKLLNLINLEENKDLSLLEELQNINETLKDIANKPDIEIPPMPEMPEPMEVIFPDVQKVEITNLPKEKEFKPTDMTMTEKLLQKLLDKEDKDVEINVSLEIV